MKARFRIFHPDIDSDYGFLHFMSLVIGSVIAVILVIANIEALIESQSCPARWSGTQHQARWSYWGGCQVTDDNGEWQPESLINLINVHVHGEAGNE